MRQTGSQRSALPRRIGRLALLTFGIGVAPALGGCFLGTERPDAALDVPGRYRMAPHNQDAALPSVVWWRGFRAKQLTDLIEEALTSNLDIAAAVARILQADALARIAGAPLIPAIDLNASAARSRSSGTTGSGTTTPTYRTNFSTSLSASYEFDFWGKNRATLRAAEELAVASRFDREVVALATVVSVANAYFLVQASYDRLNTARNNLAAAVRVFNLVDERFKVGTASALDTAQQESLVNQVRATLPLLEQQLRENIVTLAVLIGRAPAHVKVRTTGMGPIAIPPVTPGLPSDLLVQRPDIRDAEAQLAAANASVEAARAAMLPSITLTAEGGYTSAALRTLLRPESAFFSVAGGLVQPLLDGWRLQGQLDLEKGRQDELLQLYRRAVVSAFGDVERALIAVRQSAEREQLQREVVRSSRRAFEISETRLREGAVDLVTVLNTQQSLFVAEDNAHQARLARLQAVVSLFQALGGGWPLPPKRLVAAPVSPRSGQMKSP
jgi:NodT family efflux transporter outer membrane factor (OMF) lipoprotein